MGNEKGQIIPTSNGWAVAIGPGKEAHQTFQVDSLGNISGLHATAILPGYKNQKV